MDGHRFDALAKSFAGISRRDALKGVAAGIAAAAAGAIGLRDAEGRNICRAIGYSCVRDTACCSGKCGAADGSGRRRCICSSDAQCPPTGSACVISTCDGGACVTSFAESGTPCQDSDGSVCDDAGACVGCLTGAVNGAGACPNPNQSCCESSCSDLSTDTSNCGACGNVCGQGLACCDGSCVNLSSDSLNCGACGTECGFHSYTLRASCCDGFCTSRLVC